MKIKKQASKRRKKASQDRIVFLTKDVGTTG